MKVKEHYFYSIKKGAQLERDNLDVRELDWFDLTLIQNSIDITLLTSQITYNGLEASST